MNQAPNLDQPAEPKFDAREVSLPPLRFDGVAGIIGQLPSQPFIAIMLLIVLTFLMINWPPFDTISWIACAAAVIFLVRAINSLKRVADAKRTAAWLDRCHELTHPTGLNIMQVKHPLLSLDLRHEAYIIRAVVDEVAHTFQLDNRHVYFEQVGEPCLMFGSVIDTPQEPIALRRAWDYRRRSRTAPTSITVCGVPQVLIIGAPALAIAATSS